MKYLVVFLLALALIPSVQGADSIYTTDFPLIGNCIDSNYLNKTIIINVDGSNTTIEVQPATYCPFGCVENASQYGDDCRDHGFERVLVTVGFFLALTFILLFMASREQDNNPLKVLYFFIGFIMLIASASTMIEVSAIHYPEISSTVTTAYFSTIIMFFIALTWFIYGILKSLTDMAKKA